MALCSAERREAALLAAVMHVVRHGELGKQSKKVSGKTLGNRVREGDWQALRTLEAERDALREALEEIDTLCQISGLDTLVGRAARKGLAALDRRP